MSPLFSLDKIERHFKLITSSAIPEASLTYLLLNPQKQELDEKEKQLKKLGMDLDLSQKVTSAEKARSAKTLKSMKHQVTHERNLKLDAFHEVDKLINQVCSSFNCA